MWIRRLVEKIECVGAFYVTCFLRNVDDNFEQASMGVYGPNVDNGRGVLWDELAGFLVGGRITLIKSTLFNYLLFVLFSLPCWCY